MAGPSKLTAAYTALSKELPPLPLQAMATNTSKQSHAAPPSYAPLAGSEPNSPIHDEESHPGLFPTVESVPTTPDANSIMVTTTTSTNSVLLTPTAPSSCPSLYGGDSDGDDYVSGSEDGGASAASQDDAATPPPEYHGDDDHSHHASYFGAMRELLAAAASESQRRARLKAQMQHQLQHQLRQVMCQHMNAGASRAPHEDPSGTGTGHFVIIIDSPSGGERPYHNALNGHARPQPGYPMQHGARAHAHHAHVHPHAHAHAHAHVDTAAVGVESGGNTPPPSYETLYTQRGNALEASGFIGLPGGFDWDAEDWELVEGAHDVDADDDEAFAAMRERSVDAVCRWVMCVIMLTLIVGVSIGSALNWGQVAMR